MTVVALIGRLLSAFAVALVFLSAPLASWGSASAKPTSCCCPSARVCKCHDHDKGSRSTQKVERCSTGKAEIISVSLAAAVIADAPVAIAVTATAPSVAPAPLRMTDKHAAEPETPPF